MMEKNDAKKDERKRDERKRDDEKRCKNRFSPSSTQLDSNSNNNLDLKEPIYTTRQIKIAKWHLIPSKL